MSSAFWIIDCNKIINDGKSSSNRVDTINSIDSSSLIVIMTLMLV